MRGPIAPLHLETLRDGDEAVVVLRGELDTTTALTLRHAIEALRDEGRARVTLDMRELVFVDSSGLGLFVWAMKALAAGGGELVLGSPNERVTRALVITGLDRRLRIVDLDGP